MPGKARVVVVGAGFAGLTAVRALRGKPVQMTLVDRSNYHTFTPLLYQVASALLDPSEVAHPIRGIVRPIRNLEVRMATATGVDLPGRRLLTDVEALQYDFLILCTGSTTNYFGISGLADQAYGLKELDQALALRNQVLRQFEEAAWSDDEERRRTLLTFVIVGGGPTGVEFAGALSELIHGVLSKDFPSIYISETRIILVEAAGHLLGPFAHELRESARRTLERRGEPPGRGSRREPSRACRRRAPGRRDGGLDRRGQGRRHRKLARCSPRTMGNGQGRKDTPAGGSPGGLRDRRPGRRRAGRRPVAAVDSPGDAGSTRRRPS